MLSHLKSVPTINSFVKIRGLVNVFFYIAKRTIHFPYQPLNEVAIRSTTICGAHELPAITPFYWEAHLPRIRGAASHSAKQVVDQDLNRKKFFLRPVVAHWLHGATLLDGSIYSQCYRQDLRSVKRSARIGLDISGPVGHVEQGALVSTCAGSTWWGHWLEDEVPLQMLAEKFGPPIAHCRSVYRDENTYREAFGISLPERYRVAIFSELVIIDEFAQNPDKTRRYHALRRKLSLLPKGYERVFLSRGTSGTRRVLVNETQVRLRLESIGFKTLDISKCTASEVIQVCRGASVVISVEGSHLAPLLYLMQDFGTLVILNPPNQVHTTVADIAVFCGISSGMFICEAVDASPTDFYCSPDEIERFLDDTIKENKNKRFQLEKFVESVIKLK